MYGEHVILNKRKMATGACMKPISLPHLVRQSAPYLALVLAVLMAYSNVYHNQFLFDDDTLILHNQYVINGGPISHIFVSSAAGGAGIVNDFYRPLQILLYVLVNALFGFSTIAFHALNVGLHAANVCLVFALGRKLGFKPIAVFLGALLWGLHPLHTEAVTYMSATADTLYVFFCLIGLLVLLPNFSLRRIAVAGLIMVLGILSKETAVLFPLLAAACLFLVSEDRKNVKIYLRLWPFFLIAGAYYALRMTVLDFQKFDHSFDMNATLHLYATHLLIRIYTFLATLPFYAELLIYPWGLHYERQFPVYMSALHPDVMTGAVLVVATLAQLAWGRAKRGLAVSWGILWFLGAHSLNTGLLFPLNSLFLEHWMYLPSIGLWVGFTQSFVKFCEKRFTQELQVVIAILCLALAGTYGVMTYNQNAIWRDAFSFYPNVLKYGEPSTRSLNNLANAYAQKGDYDKALLLLHQSVQQYDVLPDVHQNIAAILFKEGDWQSHPDEIIAELKRALELNPNFLPSCEGLAYVYDVLGNKEQAQFYQKRVQEIRGLFTP